MFLWTIKGSNTDEYSKREVNYNVSIKMFRKDALKDSRFAAAVMTIKIKVYIAKALLIFLIQKRHSFQLLF